MSYSSQIKLRNGGGNSGGCFEIEVKDGHNEGY